MKKPNHAIIPVDGTRLPIEITLVGKLPAEASKTLVESAFQHQAIHPQFIDEFNETSALIGKTNFAANDPTAVYTFGVDTRDLVFHRHAGHRVIIGIAGKKGCILKFSTCTPEEANRSPIEFLKKLTIVAIPAGFFFTLRFDGTVYHQFGPLDPSEKALIAISVHTNEAAGLSGELLEKVLANESSIALLTEPACDEVMRLLKQPDAYKFATTIELDIE